MKNFAAKLAVMITVSLLIGAAQAVAGSATWSANPRSGDWNTAANWMQNTVPNGLYNIATFGQSAVTSVSINTTAVTVDSIVYEAGASAFTTTVDSSSGIVNLFLTGDGIVNGSGVVQSLNAGPQAAIFFSNAASAGERTSFGGAGSLFVFSGSSSAASANFDVISDAVVQAKLDFEDNSTAADATLTVSLDAIINFFGNSTAADALIEANTGGVVIFADDTTADRATVTVNPDNTGLVGSGLDFEQSASAANGSFSVGGSTSRGDPGSFVNFLDSATAGDATFSLGGGTAPGAAGPVMHFYDTSTAANATITVSGGTNGGRGASVVMNNASLGGTARFVVTGNGLFDLGKHSPYPVTTGSVEGDGRVILGANQLALGSNNLNTTFSGLVEDGSGGRGGSVSKIGTGTFTLSGSNTYSGGTTISAGALVIGNTSGSATGTGSVAVNGGTLGGGGTMSGPVMVGSGSGSGATLQPSFGTTQKVTLTMQGSLSFKSDATYSYRLKNKNAEVIANGVTIESGAQFLLTAPKKKLRAGLKATVISNTSSNPISGTFANLPDGATITSGGNTFQASYEGGDGNDLTLTVVP